MFEDLIARIGKMASDMIMGSNVEVFGSYATELSLPESDIDLVVSCQNI